MPGESCHVCLLPGEGRFFGVDVCRPCAAFFRRSVAESKRYGCAHGGACNIERGLRNSCKACRMKKCLDVGMNPPKSCRRSVSLELPSVPSSSKLAATTAPTRNPNTTPGHSHHLSDLMTALKNYFGAQKSVYLADHPENAFRKIESRGIKLKEAIGIDKKLHILLFSALSEVFPFFEQIKQESKEGYINFLSIKLRVLTKVALTAITFPDRGDMRIAHSAGHHMDMADTDAFFDDANNMASNHAKYMTEIRTTLVSKFMHLQLQESDVAFLVGLVLCQDCGFFAKQIVDFSVSAMIHLPENEQLDEYQSNLIREYHNELNTKYHPSQSPLHFAQVFLFHTQLMEHVTKLMEGVSIIGIFGPQLYSDLKNVYYL